MMPPDGHPFRPLKKNRSSTTVIRMAVRQNDALKISRRKHADFFTGKANKRNVVARIYHDVAMFGSNGGKIRRTVSDESPYPLSELHAASGKGMVGLLRKDVKTGIALHTISPVSYFISISKYFS